MRSSYKTLVASAAILGGLATANINANIVGPYTADVNTLHLWHMDQTTVPVVDSVTSGGTNLTSLQNGATLGNASYPGFGSAVNTYGPGPNFTGSSYLAPQTLPNDPLSTYANPTTGAFTYEAVIQVIYNPSLNLGPPSSGGTGRNTALTIIAGEGNSNPLRVFQFRVDPIGYNPGSGTLIQPSLEFINVNQNVSVQSIVVPIPYNDGNPDDIVQNGWYHVAVTYNGQPNTPGNLNFYWTLMDSNRTAATLIGSRQMTLNLPAGLSPNFVVGNTGRNPGGGTSTTPVNANFLGNIDEVRMSKVALAQGQMMFSAPTITIDVDVTNQVTVLGQTVNFAVSASGVPPLRYQWRYNSNNILGATQAVYTIPAVSLADVGNYDVIITNSAGSVTSSLAPLVLVSAPRLLSPAWTSNGVFTFTLNGNAGFNYAIEATTNLRAWSPIQTVSNASGQILFTETNLSAYPFRAYRARLIP